MRTRLKDYLRLLRTAEPGKRFQQYFSRRHQAGSSNLRRVLTLGLGGLVVAVGLVLMPAPGPGILVVAAGAALMAGESLWMARGLDRAEILARKLWRRWRSRT